MNMKISVCSSHTTHKTNINHFNEQNLILVLLLRIVSQLYI
eukprot:UN25769